LGIPVCGRLVRSISELELRLRRGAISPESRELLIVDPHSVPETFITSVVDFALVSKCSIVVSLGVRRYLRPKSSVEPQDTIVINNNRLALTLEAAKNLVEVVSAMLNRAKDQSTLKRPDKLS
jgi:hypothetical protein